MTVHLSVDANLLLGLQIGLLVGAVLGAGALMALAIWWTKRQQRKGAPT